MMVGIAKVRSSLLPSLSSPPTIFKRQCPTLSSGLHISTYYSSVIDPSSPKLSGYEIFTKLDLHLTYHKFVSTQNQIYHWDSTYFYLWQYKTTMVQRLDGPIEHVSINKPNIPVPSLLLENHSLRQKWLKFRSLNIIHKSCFEHYITAT